MESLKNKNFQNNPNNLISNDQENSNNKFFKNILDTNFKNLEYLIYTFNNNENKISNIKNFLIEKISLKEKNVEKICQEAKEYFQEINKKIKNFLENFEEKNSKNNFEICKLINETTNFTKFFEFSKSIDSEILQIKSFKDMIFEKEKNFEENFEGKLIGKKTNRNSEEEESTRNADEIEKDLSSNLLNNDNTNLNLEKSLLNNSKDLKENDEDRKTTKNKKMKREIKGLGWENNENKKDSRKKNEYKDDENDAAELKKDKKIKGVALYNKIKEKEKENEVNLAKENNKSNIDEKEEEEIENLQIENEEISEITESISISSEESFKPESYKFQEKKNSPIKNINKKTKKFRKIIKKQKIPEITIAKEENELIQQTPIDFVSKTCTNLKENENQIEENFLKIFEKKNINKNEINIKIIENLTDLCESLGKENSTNSINDYLISNLENCISTKRLYYCEFNFNEKKNQKKFNYEYLTKDNLLIEKIENFQNVKLVIVRKGKENINNLLKTMENFFKIFVKRKDTNGSAMIKGVLNCSFDKLLKYYNSYMKSFEYCNAIQIEVFLFKWDLFIDYNEDFDKTNLNKMEIWDLVSNGNKLNQARCLMKNMNLVNEVNKEDIDINAIY